jgi:hypothetical protein
VQAPKDDGSYRGEAKPVASEVNSQLTEDISSRQALPNPDHTVTFDDDPDPDSYTDASRFDRDRDPEKS